MFTGIIEKIGEIASFIKKGQSAALIVKCLEIREGLKAGDSIAVDGVCMTAVKEDLRGIHFDLSPETLLRSTTRFYKKGMRVNLERAAKLGDRIGGHLISGHIDGTGKITGKKKTGSGMNVKIEIPKKLNRYIIDKGSIAVDGISLTVAESRVNSIVMALIPHTIKTTTLSSKKTGSSINIECDQVGKYVEKFTKKVSLI